jgi:hypothetical protein
MMGLVNHTSNSFGKKQMKNKILLQLLKRWFKTDLKYYSIEIRKIVPPYYSTCIIKARSITLVMDIDDLPESVIEEFMN